MAINNSTYCIDNNRTLSVDFNGNTPLIGEVWNVTPALDSDAPFCVTITTGITEPTSAYLLDTQYIDCYDCLSNNYGVVTVADCVDKTPFLLTLESFGSLPSVGDVYYMTFTYGERLFTSCYTIQTIIQLTSKMYDANIIRGSLGNVIGTPILQIDCPDCLANNSLPYAVKRCTDGGVTDYVLLINDSYINHIISYSDGINQYCGTVISQTAGIPQWTFITDYGLSNIIRDGTASCEDCLANVNEKILIANCLDPNITEVVWASTLFNNGDVSNLSTENGCFTVVGPTGATVTIDSFLNFDPQPGCDPCIECNGINYQYETCYPVSGFSYDGLIDFGGASETPFDVEYNPDTQHIYTTTQSTRMIVVDPSTNSVYTQYTFPGGGYGDVLYYDTNTMYLTSTNQSSIRKLDTSIDISGTTTPYSIGTTSFRMTKDLPNNRLFITCSDYSVKIFNTLTNTVTGSISTASGYYEEFISYDPINDEVYTTASGGYSVEVYNPNTLSHVTSIPVNGSYDIAYEPNSGNMYVTCSGYNQVKVIDTTTKTVTNTIATPQSPGNIRYNNYDGYIYVALPNGLLKINPLTNGIVATNDTVTPSTNSIYGFDFYDVNNNIYLGFNDNDGGNDGLRYFSQTGGSTLSGYIKSYQYLQNGSVFYNPAIDECCTILGTSSSYYDILYSVETFSGNDDDCATCYFNGQPNIQIWNASACTNSNTYSSFYVTTDNTVAQGDIVKLMWGSNEWICAGLINTVNSNSGYYTYYNTQKNGLGDTLKYDSCENCNSQGLIGVTLVNCNTGVESFVSITLDNYLSIYSFDRFALPNYSVSDKFGNCYQISNLCPIPLEEEGFTPVEFYFNCIICSEDNPGVVPRSANTESTVCEICCDCGATGSTINIITPPHPVWTDGYGTPVTQLNMIVIGGNGLNS
jgi:DNA-binding beta-propeller fold protein YncE